MGAPQGFMVVPIGVDPDGDLRMLELDADDALKVVFGEAAKGLVGSHGWISSDWQKDPIRLGFSDRFAEQNTGTLDGSGQGGAALTVVPSGEIWVVTHIATRNESAVSTTAECVVNDGTSDYSLAYQANLAQWLYLYYIGYLVLEAGDKVSSWHTGGGAGSTVRTIAWGHKIDVDQ